MSDIVKNTSLPGVFLIEPKIFEDSRGFFLETFHREKYLMGEIRETFIQDNHSYSKRSVLRGLHYQLQYPQGKLVYAATGEIFDVAVDIRRGSPTFGKWEGFNLSAKNKRQLFIPGGFAHGFYVLSDGADVLYKCTDFYHSEDDYGILWSDPAIGIEWPISEGSPPNLSLKDRQYQGLEEIRESHLPVY